jgi:hypothetical protein
MGDQGVDPKSKKALFLLNRARRMIHPLDDWLHTIKYYCVDLCECCFLLPWDAKAIRAAWDGDRVIEISNEYFDSIPRELAMDCKRDQADFFRTGLRIPAPFSVNGKRKIGFVARDACDAGKEIKVAYINRFGSKVSDKIELTDDFRPTFTAQEPAEIISFDKDRTNGNVDVIINNRKVSQMKPRYTCESHEQYKIKGSLCCSRVLIKCKVKHIDYTEEDYDELIDIDSIDALEFAAMAYTAKQKNELREYQVNLLTARTHLEVDKIDIESSNKGFERMFAPDVIDNRYDAY